MRLRSPSRHWGLLNFTWGVGDRWGVHLLVTDWSNWRWGRDDNAYDCLMSYWGLGPLGCVSRVN